MGVPNNSHRDFNCESFTRCQATVALVSLFDGSNLSFCQRVTDTKESFRVLHHAVRSRCFDRSEMDVLRVCDLILFFCRSVCKNGPKCIYCNAFAMEGILVVLYCIISYNVAYCNVFIILCYKKDVSHLVVLFTRAVISCHALMGTKRPCMICKHKQAL